MSLTQLLILSFATYRTTRLWQVDTIAEPLRDRLYGALLARATPRRLWVFDLLSCRWCLSVHVALWLTVAGVWATTGWVGPQTLVWGFLWWMAAAALATTWFLVEDLLAAAGERLDGTDDD